MRQVLALALGATCAVAGAAGLSAQDLDVEMLGRIYGTRPPDAYFELRQREPQAFQLQRGLAAGRGLPAGGRGVDARLGRPLLRRGGGAPGLVFPNRGVRGTFRFPVLPGKL